MTAEGGRIHELVNGSALPLQLVVRDSEVRIHSAALAVRH